MLWTPEPGPCTKSREDRVRRRDSASRLATLEDRAGKKQNGKDQRSGSKPAARTPFGLVQGPQPKHALSQSANEECPWRVLSEPDTESEGEEGGFKIVDNQPTGFASLDAGLRRRFFRLGQYEQGRIRNIVRNREVMSGLGLR